MSSIDYREDNELPPTPVYGFKKVQTGNITWRATVGNILNENLDKIEQVISGGGAGTRNYNELENKPKINNVEIVGNMDSESLGIFSSRHFEHETLTITIDGVDEKHEIVTWVE